MQTKFIIKRVFSLLKKRNLFFFISFLIIRCSNNLEIVRSISAIDTLPLLKIENFYYEYSELGKIKITAKANILIQQYKTDDTIFLFPNGLEINFYEKYPILESKVTCGYAKFLQKNKLWEAKKNVMAINSKGDTLFTEQLFWDQKLKKIYGYKYTRINTKSGTIIGNNGFESDEKLSYWKVYKTSGIINVEVE
mgnify:CR=1 FL=1